MSDEPEVSTDLAALMLAEERVALWLLTGAPAKPGAITIAEITAGENVSNRVFADGTYIRATNSDAINRPLLSGGNSSGVGASQYEGQLDIARYLDSNGHAIEDEDLLWDAARTKGTTLWFAKRVGPKWDAAPSAGDEVSVFKVTTDNPQDPQTFSDYIEKIVPIPVSDAWLDQVLVAP